MLSYSEKREGVKMILGNESIANLIDDGYIDGADKGAIGSVTYDLTTLEFFRNRTEHKTCYALKPGESVFVSSKETVCLPDDVSMRVVLRNSRIRQGMSLDAPLYQPGHKTRVFFRITNVSSDEIRIDSGDGIASVVFERVEGCTKAYDGSFSNEFDFRGMGDYERMFEKEMRSLSDKENAVLGIEQRMYGSVVGLMAVFVGIFSIVNVNIAASFSDASPIMFLVANLATVGSLAGLAGFISLILGSKNGKVIPWVVAAIAFALAIAVAVGTRCI